MHVLMHACIHSFIRLSMFAVCSELSGTWCQDKVAESILWTWLHSCREDWFINWLDHMNRSIKKVLLAQTGCGCKQRGKGERRERGWSKASWGRWHLSCVLKDNRALSGRAGSIPDKVDEMKKGQAVLQKNKGCQKARPSFRCYGTWIYLVGDAKHWRHLS